MILQFYAKLLFWLGVMLNFSKFDFNGLDLFILLMHIPISYQVHIIHTYISYCFVFEVSDLCIPLALTMLPLQISDAWTHNFYNT